MPLDSMYAINKRADQPAPYIVCSSVLLVFAA